MLLRSRLGPLACAACLVAATSAATATDDYAVEMEIRFLGMNIGRVDLEATTDGDDRAQRLAMATTGLIERLTGFRGELTASSRVAPTGPVPRDFSSFTHTDRATREVTVRYDDAGHVVDLESLKRGQPQRTEVPEDLRHGTLDPLTALARIRRWLAEARDAPPAALTLPVFDGRRRFDLEVAYVDRRVADFASGPTPILELQLTSRPIAGFDEGDREPRTVTALVSDDELLVPLIMRTEVLGDMSAALYAKRVCAGLADGATCRDFRY